MLATDRILSIRVGSYSSKDIQQADFNYGYIKGDTFKPGGTTAGTAKIKFTRIISSFKKLDKLYPEIGLLVNGTFEWISMGEYYISDVKIDRNRNSTELELIDGMFKFNRPYVSNLAYPAQIRDVIREICTKTGVTLESEDLGFRAIQHHVQKKPDKKDITFREVLSQVIQLLGYSAFFNRKGNLEIRGLKDSNLTITADHYFLHGLTKSEIEYQIAGITCKKDKEELTVGLRTGRSLEIENILMTKPLLDELYNDLKQIKYFPYTLNWQGHLKLEVGQWVTILTNKNETYKVPVLSQSFSFSGGLKSKIGADSKSGNDTQYAYKGFLVKKIEQVSTDLSAEVQQQIEYADQKFEEQTGKLRQDIDDNIQKSTATAKKYSESLSNDIRLNIEAFQNKFQFDLQSQDYKISEILDKANTSINLATQAKTDAIAEANRLVESATTLLSGQVSNVSTDLAKTNDSIKLLASKQSIEALSGRLSSTEANLQVQAEKIEQRLTATQVEQAISGKGFATMSSVQNLVTETAERFTRTISRTESQLSNILSSFNAVEDTVSSHTRTIAEQGKSLSQVIQTSTGLVSRVGDLVDGRNLIYGATKLPKYISSVATDTHLERVGWGDHDGIRINYTQSMSGWLGFRLPLTKKFVRTGDRFAYRIEIAVDVIPENNMVLIQLLDNTSGLGMYYNSSRTITSTGNHVFTGFIDIPKTGELNEYSLRFTLTRPGNIVIHKPTIVESDTIPEKFFDNTDYTTEYNRTLVTQLSNSWSVQNINSAGDLISGINLGANGNNRIDGKATHITGQTLIDNAVIKSAMIDKLKTANFETGSVTTSILSSEAVTADKLKVDQALFNKLMANEAYLKQLFAKNAFITQVQSVTVSASKISGGVLTANNGNSTFNLNNGVITMQASPTSWKTTWDANGIAFRGSNNAVWGAMGGDSGGGMGIYMRGDRAFTVVLNHSDNGSTTSYTPIRFKYGEGTTLQFSPNGPSYNLLTLFRTIFSNFQNGTRNYYEMK